eukprot:1552769-Amphidinium_carterae.1
MVGHGHYKHNVVPVLVKVFNSKLHSHAKGMPAISSVLLQEMVLAAPTTNLLCLDVHHFKKGELNKY